MLDNVWQCSVFSQNIFLTQTMLVQILCLINTLTLTLRNIMKEKVEFSLSGDCLSNFLDEAETRGISPDELAAEVFEINHLERGAQVPNPSLFWQRFAVCAGLFLALLSAYWITETNERWKEASEIGILEAKSLLLLEKRHAAKDDRIDELNLEVEVLHKQLFDAEAFKFSLVDFGPKRDLAKSYARLNRYTAEFIESLHDPNVINSKADQFGKWWTWENVGERFSEDTYLVGRKIINLHFEIHRKKRAAHPEDLGAAENVR